MIQAKFTLCSDKKIGVKLLSVKGKALALCELANFEHFSTASAARSSNGWSSVLQLDLLRTLYFAGLFALHAVTCNHVCSSAFVRSSYLS